MLTIIGDTEVREPFMFGKCMDLYVFYCLCYVYDVYTDISEDQVVEERETELNEEEDIIVDAIREEHCRDVSEEGDNKKKMYAPRWEIHVKEKEWLIKRYFLVSVPHPKGGTIFGLV